jgi:hypothetical protein
LICLQNKHKLLFSRNLCFVSINPNSTLCTLSKINSYLRPENSIQDQKRTTMKFQNKTISKRKEFQTESTNEATAGCFRLI